MIEILLPKDKCPIDVISELKDSAVNAWIFFDNNCTCWLRTRGCNVETDRINKLKTITMHWESTENSPETTICIQEYSKDWYTVLFISAEDILFKERTETPTEIYLLKKEI